jgi:hypothetical protein
MAAVTVTGCDTAVGNTGDNSDDAAALEIRNESSVTLTGIKWNDEEFDDEGRIFTPGSIFTKRVSKTKVKDNNGYLFFTKGGLLCRTAQIVNFAADTVFTFTDFTVVVDMADRTNIGTLMTIAVRLLKPTGVYVYASNTRLAVQWTAVDGADSYNVYYGTSETPQETPGQAKISKTTTLITGLTNEVTYYVWIQGVNTGGVSPLSETATGVPVNDYTVNSTDAYNYAIIGINADMGVSSYTINVANSFNADSASLSSGNKTIKIKGNDTTHSISSAVFNISNGTVLELENITLTSSTLNVDADGTLVIKTGALITGSGRGVFVDGGTVNMTGGTISGNATSSTQYKNTASEAFGGGVYINRGTFVMTGGSITNNRASYDRDYDFTNDYLITQSYGGGVYINNGTFTMSSGRISGNSCYAPQGLSTTRTYGCGGGVYVKNGHFNMTGGTISGNFANTSYSSHSSYGGGVYVSSDGTFSQTGGAVTDDNSADIGKAVCWEQ